MRRVLVGAMIFGMAAGFLAPSAVEAQNRNDDCTRDCSHVLVALLQSESTGEEPSFEIGTVDMLFRMGQPLGFHLIGMASLDIAVTEKEGEEGGGSEVEPKSDDLTDAGITIAVPSAVQNREREWFVGATARIFQTDPMAGLVVGSVETNDFLYGSRFSLGWTWPLLRGASNTENLAPQNLFAEFLFRFPDVDDEGESVIGLLKHLNFRGSILIPNSDDHDILAKIAVIVPIRGPFKFGR